MVGGPLTLESLEGVLGVVAVFKEVRRDTADVEA